MSRLALILWTLLLTCSRLAADEAEHFAEFSEPEGKTRIYDLRTVQLIQPGRFTIISTSIDDADVMKLELRVLDTLRTYCTRPDGQYPPPTDLFTLGSPDLPVESINVKSSQSGSGGVTRQFKSASWSYPYARFALEDGGKSWPKEVRFYCKQGNRDDGELYLEQRASITNGA